MPIPEVADGDSRRDTMPPTESMEPADEELADDALALEEPQDDDPTASEDDTALQLDAPLDLLPVPTTKAAPPPSQPPTDHRFPLGRLIALSVLVLSLALLAAAIAFDFFSTETVIIDVPRE